MRRHVRSRAAMPSALTAHATLAWSQGRSRILLSSVCWYLRSLTLIFVLQTQGLRPRTPQEPPCRRPPSPSVAADSPSGRHPDRSWSVLLLLARLLGGCAPRGWRPASRSTVQLTGPVSSGGEPSAGMPAEGLPRRAL